MSTVFWNGKELAGDSRVTRTQNGQESQKDGAYQKVHEGKGLTFRGKPVQAWGITGCARLLEVMVKGQQHLIARNQVEELEEAFDDLGKHEIGSNSRLLLVLEHALVEVTITKGTPNTWNAVWRNRDHWYAIGSGACAMNNWLNQADEAEREEALREIPTAPIATVMANFNLHDQYTGGQVHVWTLEAGVQAVENTDSNRGQRYREVIEFAVDVEAKTFDVTMYKHLSAIHCFVGSPATDEDLEAECARVVAKVVSMGFTVI